MKNRKPKSTARPASGRRLSAQAMANRRKSQAEARRAQTRQGQDIGKIPPCKNPKRRAACEADFGLACKTYFPDVFKHPWSKDQLKVIRKTERVMNDHDKFVVAMPRGAGKSSLCRAAAVMGSVSGKHPFVVLIGATAVRGTDSMGWVKETLSGNDLLLEDYPEVCYPIRCLENEARKCVGQRYKGQRTNCKWGKDQIVFPTIPGSKASGFAFLSTGIEGQLLGLWHTLPDGRIARPTMAIVDDPQTPEVARSQGPNGQVTYRLKTIIQAVQGLAGQDQQTAILVPCTVIEPGDLADQLLNRKLHPGFRGERTKRLYSWPTNKLLWEEYRQIRETALQTDQSLAESIEFYRARMCSTGRKLDTPPAECEKCPHRANCMDCGVVVDSIYRLDDPRNLSAAQAAMHSFYEYGAAGFAAEFQNEPLSAQMSGQRWSQDLIASRFTGRPRFEVPLDCTEISVGVDVQQWSLWYVVVAWMPNFTGHVIDYGIWPEQPRRNITKAEIENSLNNLQTKYPGRGVTGAIQAGLEDFTQWMLARNFPRAGGAGLMRVSRMLVDSGKWPDNVAAAKMKCGGAVMSLSKGVGIRAGTPPMSSRKAKKGEGKRDPFGHWYEPAVQGTKDFKHVAIDTNYWKSFLEESFLTAPGDPGAMTLFGSSADEHSLFAAHLDAETWVETEGHGRKVHEWTIRPTRPDNEFLDSLVYATVGASYQGCARSGSSPARVGVQKKRVSIAEMLARSNQGVGA